MIRSSPRSARLRPHGPWRQDCGAIPMSARERARFRSAGDRPPGIRIPGLARFWPDGRSPPRLGTRRASRIPAGREFSYSKSAASEMGRPISGIRSSKYWPYSLSRVFAIASSCAALINPFMYATSSMQAILSPWRTSIVWTKLLASTNDSWVPVSSQAKPRPSGCTRSCPRRRYARLRSVISSSPRDEGCKLAAIHQMVFLKQKNSFF